MLSLLILVLGVGDLGVIMYIFGGNGNPLPKNDKQYGYPWVVGGPAVKCVLLLFYGLHLFMSDNRINDTRNREMKIMISDFLTI